MTPIEEITELVEKIIERGELIAPNVIVGLDVYSKIKHEAIQKTNNPYSSSGPLMILEIVTLGGSLIINVDTTIPADRISIGGRTLLDIIAEEILLGN